MNTFQPGQIEDWIQAEWAHHAPLGQRDVRKGIQSLSQLYVERAKGIESKAASAPARRAASAIYFGPLHALSTQIVLRSLPTPADPQATVVDLGCGSGAVGATVVHAGFGSEVRGVDVASWAPAAAARTYAALGVRGQAATGRLPGALGWPANPALLVFGWSLNELTDSAREGVRKRIESGLRKGCGLLILEPLSRRITPWWDTWAGRMRRLGAVAVQEKAHVTLPPTLRDLDRAARLDHRTLGARAIYRPVG